MRHIAYPTLAEAVEAACSVPRWFAYRDPELAAWGWYPADERLGAGRWVKQQWIAETDAGPVEEFDETAY